MQQPISDKMGSPGYTGVFHLSPQIHVGVMLSFENLLLRRAATIDMGQPEAVGLVRAGQCQPNDASYLIVDS